jgi:hypothetical protein
MNEKVYGVVCGQCNNYQWLGHMDWSSIVCSECKALITNPKHPTEGVKFDDDKLPYELLAPEFLEATTTILKFGADKYGGRNWEKGMAWSRPFGALMRHMWAWWAGEKVDEESGQSHLWHAACCIMFLIAYEQRKTGEDDRP